MQMKKVIQKTSFTIYLNKYTQENLEWQERGLTFSTVEKRYSACFLNPLLTLTLLAQLYDSIVHIHSSFSQTLDFAFFLIQRKFPIEWKPASLECSDTSKIVPMYWAGKKFHLCFSITSYRKIHTNFLANPIERSLLKLNSKAKNKSVSSAVKRQEH